MLRHEYSSSRQSARPHFKKGRQNGRPIVFLYRRVSSGAFFQINLPPAGEKLEKSSRRRARKTRATFGWVFLFTCAHNLRYRFRTFSLFSNHSCGKWLTLQKPNRFRMGPERYGEGWVDSFLCTSRQRFLFYGIYSVFLVFFLFFSILYSVITIMVIYIFFKWMFFFYLRPYTMFRFCDR